MNRRLPGIALVANAVLAPSSLYLLASTVVAITSRRPGTHRLANGQPQPAGPASTRFVVVVPAHNEESTIGAMLASMSAQRYPSNRFSVHVVADNCTDRTADVVRDAGHTVHERTDAEHPGKGPALNWLLQALVRDSTHFDVAVFVDADTVVDADFLRVMELRFVDGAVAVQGFYGVLGAFASTPATLRYCALAARHHLRPIARTTFGGSCGLFGNGMAFRRDLIVGREWTDHLVEDMQFQLELLHAGVRVQYEPLAQVEAEMPHTFANSVTQHQRWERGRFSLISTHVPRLARQVVTGPTRRAAADAIADMAVPPLSMMGAATVAATGLGVLSSLRTRRVRLSAVLGVSMCATLAFHVLAALRLVAAPREAYRSLLHAPRLAAWKVKVLLGARTNGQWIRTARNAETIDQ